MCIIQCYDSKSGSNTPLTPSQKAKPHINSAICALIFTILFGLQCVCFPNTITSAVIFFPLLGASLFKTLLETKLAYDVYNTISEK